MQNRSQQVARGLQAIANRIVKNKDILSSYGIEILDSNDKLKSTFQILGELKPKWDIMSDSQRVALGTTLAGVNQYKVLASTLQAYDKAQESFNSALMSSGTTMKQNEVYMDSLQAKITSLKPN